MFEYQYPDALGHFGRYGGSFASETLTHALAELRDAYARYQNDPEFIKEFQSELAHYVGRPSPSITRTACRVKWAVRRSTSSAKT